ncbi:MAG: Secretion system C-terminal sorting domain, partial [Bacteroidota bacterium]
IEEIINSCPDESIAFEVCASGSENSCKCSTTTILNKLEALGGYEFDMTTFEHPLDGPTPMCSGPEGMNTAAQNPTWIAFKALCKELILKVIYTNCTNPQGPALGGIQVGVYSGCPATANNAIACDTDVNLCNGDNERILDFVNLEIGKIYYLLFDGCSGSACHIKLDVLTCETTSIIDDESISIKIYPNPSTGSINISSNSELKEGDISVYNMQGQKVYFIYKKQDVENYNIEGLPEGLFFIKIEKEEKIGKTMKVLVIR